MEEKQLTKEDINLIFNPTYSENYWYDRLGKAISDAEISEEKYISPNFYEEGKKYLLKIHDKLSEILCDREKKTPKPEFDLFLKSDDVEAALAVGSVIIDNLDVNIQIALPLLYFSIKGGLRDFCASS